ncbi:MAG TPA: 2,3-bisphosphoglycerate-independent phosphoglycerate mutase [Bacteroidia bacterium]|nr:2,3-bisphosphoglycerate-independent phosphoglycerate mutase [Bacteroidia bacterium]
MTRKALLVILDGWGKGREDNSNAIYKAQPAFFNQLLQNYPNAQLRTDGENVGLPDGQMGNSEVGHLNIGAGRVVYQNLVLINKAFRERTIHSNPAILNAINYAKSNNKKVHLIGLVSDGGVHSHIEHLIGLCRLCEENQLQNVFIHAFTDGRDTDPKGGESYLKHLMEATSSTHAKIASVVGRYYAMDRDKRWERVKLAYDAMVNGIGTPTRNVLQSIEHSYSEGVTDEFIKPIICVDEKNQPLATIAEDDVVICFNFRTDRGRQITTALTQQDFHEFNMHKLKLHYVTMTNYDNTYENVNVVFKEDNLQMTLGEVLEKNKLTQMRIAETEKYPHVTFFFSGGREVPFQGEERSMCPSPKVATYDLQPEMSAEEVCNATLEALKKGFDFIVVNFANPDMVGHTGDFNAVMKAIKKVDDCLKRVVYTAQEQDYNALIIADHGNADFMINDDGTPNTAHTTNPVWCICTDKSRKVHNGILADVAPSILDLMGVVQPAEMTGKSMLS